MSKQQDWISSPASVLRGELDIPGDKSVTHRALILGALARGDTHIDGFLESADTQCTETILRALGVRIEAPAPGRRVVHGVGLHGLQAPNEPLDCRNSGTAMRLLAGLLSAQPFDSVLVGDASLSHRPMQRVIDPLVAMGARIEAGQGGFPPLRIRGGRTLHGIDYRSPVASAQVKSALLLAGLYADAETAVREPSPTRDYTERMLAARGARIQFEPGKAKLRGLQELSACDIVVPADFSSAAFFVTAATLVPGSRLRLRRIGLNPRRTGLLRVLRAMGADIVEEDARESGGEYIADFQVRHAPLRGVEVPVEHVADMIDEFPILFMAAACAQGVTVIHGASELRVKESDRIAVMLAGLRALGIRAEESVDGATIEGGILHGGEVDARGDHRCAMAFAVAGAVARAPVYIHDCANVGTSFPGFAVLASGCGMRVVMAGQS